jgi:hypothetical protein
MTGIEVGLAFNLGMLLLGAMLRSHAPRVWRVLGPLFGAASSAAQQPPVTWGAPPATPPPPPETPPAGSAVPRGNPPSSGPNNRLLAALAGIPEPSAEDELEEVLHRYVSKQQQGRRLNYLLQQAQREAVRQTGEGEKRAPIPQPSVN